MAHILSTQNRITHNYTKVTVSNEFILPVSDANITGCARPIYVSSSENKEKGSASTWTPSHQSIICLPAPHLPLHHMSPGSHCPVSNAVRSAFNVNSSLNCNTNAAAPPAEFTDKLAGGDRGGILAYETVKNPLQTKAWFWFF